MQKHTEPTMPRLGMQLSKPRCLAQGLALLALLCQATTSPAATCNGDFCTLDMNSRIWINNNVWGVDNYAPGQYQSSITTLGANSWRTDFNLPNIGGGVKVYNSAVLGWHYGWHFPTGTGLATQLSANQNVNTTYSYTADFGGGTANVAYDCWLHTIPNPTYGAAPNAPTDEIMVWVNTTGGAGALGSYIAMGISVGGSTWNLKRGNIGWEVWSFVRTSNSGSGSLNIKDFTDYLRNNYGLSSSKYLTSVQFGTEVFSGVGNLNVNNYTCTVGGGGSGGPVANGTYKIIARHSAKALDVAGNGTANGANVQQYAYGGGNNQRWTLNHLGSSQYSIIGVGSGKGLDVNGASTADGANVQIWTYGGANNQKWTLAATSGGYYSVRAVHSNKALDVNGNSTANGANVQQWTYGGGNNQQWIFQAP